MRAHKTHFGLNLSDRIHFIRRHLILDSFIFFKSKDRFDGVVALRNKPLDDHLLPTSAIRGHCLQLELTER